MGELDPSITGRRVAVRRRKWLLVLYLLLVIAVVVYAVRFGSRRHDWGFFVFYGCYGLANVATVLRPPTQVTAQGVGRPWRRTSFVPWSEVSSVVAAQPGMGPMRLQLSTGQRVPLTDISGDLVAAVAALGGKDVVRADLPTVSAPPAPPRPRTDTEVLGDVTRQAQQLARQREELAALSRRLRP